MSEWGRRAGVGWMLAMACAVVPLSVRGATPAALEESVPFIAGTEGYASFRIPSLLVAPNGTLLAFCEGRKGGTSDSGDIDTVLKRSTDGGRTWGPLQVVADDGPNTFGNPCAVVDRKAGTLWLLLTHNLGRDTESQIIARTAQSTRTVWVTQSTDAGATWAPPRDITSSVKEPGWTWYATGPGIGIQLRSGRLLIPCDHAEGSGRQMVSHVFFSDDHGKSWKLGGKSEEKTDECQAAQLNDGTVLLNMRSYHGKNRRAVARSQDGGVTWAPLEMDETLVEPVCQASLFAWHGLERRSQERLLFSNPASTRRERMMVRMSADGGRTWPVGRVLHAGPAAYSCLAQLPGERVGCLYEQGERNAYERIVLDRFPLAWLTESKPEQDPGSSPGAQAR